jgi:RNA recognition motif-containing protein
MRFARPDWWAAILCPFPFSPESIGGLSLSRHGSFSVGKKLYCGNLSYNTSSSDLDQLFSEYGQVQSAEVIMDRDTGRSKGFGFVEMSSDAEAQAAIEGLNLKEHDGRSLTVNEARPREERRGGGGGGGGRGGYGGGGGRGGGGGGRRGY